MTVRTARAALVTTALATACVLGAVSAPAAAAPVPNPSTKLSPSPTSSTAPARATASLAINPASGPAGTRVTATYTISGASTCPAGARFEWDGGALGSAPMDPRTCSASLVFPVPADASAGGHTVGAATLNGSDPARTSFTVADKKANPTTAAPSPTAAPSRTAAAAPPKPTVTPSGPSAPAAVNVRTDAPLPGADSGAIGASDPFSLGYLLGGVLLLAGVVMALYALYRFRRTAANRLLALRRRPS
jgi:hypothetical protein